jgi:hypothetical protein
MRAGFASPDADAMRRCMGRFTTGVAVVTTVNSDGTPQGMTINSLTPDRRWSGSEGNPACRPGVTVRR